MLEGERLRRLLSLLASLPVLATQRSRRLLLETAGLGELAAWVDLEGAPFTVAGAIVDVLKSYGSLPGGNSALGAFLNAVKETVGASATQAAIDQVLLSERLMTPVKVGAFVSSWHGTRDEGAQLEVIVGENTLRHIAFLETAIDVSRAVAFVDAGGWSGTGFLAGGSLLITNHHVLPDRACAADAVYRFNYQLTRDGTTAPTEDFKAKQGGIYHSNAERDYAIVELEGTPGERWGSIALSPAVPAVKSRVNIIQHPGGRPKQVSLQNNFVEYADTALVQYRTSTMPGSSGSPVLDDKWRAVAVHHAGGVLNEPGTDKCFYRNEGIAIGSLLQDLPPQVKGRLP